MARAGIRTFADGLAVALKKFSDEQVAEQSATLARTAEAAAEVDAAFALTIEDATRIDTVSGPENLTAVDHARLPRDWAYAAQKSRYAVNQLFEASGGSGIYDSSELQRIWRDVNSAAQHFAFTWDTAMTGFGRSIVGLPPTKFALRGRS